MNYSSTKHFLCVLFAGKCIQINSTEKINQFEEKILHSLLSHCNDVTLHVFKNSLLHNDSSWSWSVHKTTKVGGFSSVNQRNTSEIPWKSSKMNNWQLTNKGLIDTNWGPQFVYTPVCSIWGYEITHAPYQKSSRRLYTCMYGVMRYIRNVLTWDKLNFCHQFS